MTAFFAFIGGLAAVALKGYVDLWLEGERDRRALQSAARLVFDELGNTAAYMHAVLKQAEWWRINTDDFSTASWDEHKELLAAHMNFSDWRAVGMAYDRARSLARANVRAMSSPEVFETERVRGNPAFVPIDAAEKEGCELDVGLIEDGIKTLSPYASRPGRPRLLQRWWLRLRRFMRLPGGARSAVREIVERSQASVPRHHQDTTATAFRSNYGRDERDG